MGVLKNIKHEAFAQGIAKGMQYGDAYRAAGYEASPSSASVNASRLLKDARITSRLSEILASREKLQEKAFERAIEKTAISKEWVIERLVENVQRAMQAKPVMIGGVESGEYKYEGPVANRALELLGKELGMFIDRKEVGGPGDFARMSEDELHEFINNAAPGAGLSLAGASATAAAKKAHGPGRPH